MIIKIDNKVYYVKWRHKRPETDNSKKLDSTAVPNEIPFRGSTQCLITEGSPKGKIVADDTVIRHFKDPFIKREGRKFSMRKALENSQIPRIYFGEFWKNF